MYPFFVNTFWKLFLFQLFELCLIDKSGQDEKLTRNGFEFVQRVKLSIVL